MTLSSLRGPTGISMFLATCNRSSNLKKDLLIGSSYFRPRDWSVIGCTLKLTELSDDDTQLICAEWAGGRPQSDPTEIDSKRWTDKILLLWRRNAISILQMTRV